MDDLAFFHAGTVRICSSLDINDVLKGCFFFLKKFFPLELIEFTKMDKETQTVRILARYSEFEVKHPLNQPIRMNEKASAFAKAKFFPGDVLFLDSTDPIQPSREMANLLGMPELSGLGMLLGIESKLIGMVAVLSRRLNQFTQEHARMLKLLHDPFAIAMSNHLRFRKVMALTEMLADDNRYLHKELYRISGDKIVGRDRGLSKVMQRVGQVAPMASNVLLLGETGVGKEIIANAIHYLSPRRNGPLIKLNCGGIPDGLIDSELFGHEKGAFTGAGALHRGRFERAHGGTLFLDEIGELPLKAQVRLLRVLQERKIERVGGAKPVEVDVRIIAATHRDLKSLVREGKFRQDLFYRLNVFPITIPALRDRNEDIPEFVQHFIDCKVKELSLPRRPEVSLQALQGLMQYKWPGNVRELENTVERELIRHSADNSPLQFEDILAALSDSEHKATMALDAAVDASCLSLDRMIKNHIKKVLSLTNGKVQGNAGAAALLELNPSTLRHRMRKLGIGFGQLDRKSGVKSETGPSRDIVPVIPGPSRDQVNILNCCLTEKAISELMQIVGRSNRTKFRNNVLKPLIKAGWIEMTLPLKPTSSKQKYRLTRQGKIVLKKNVSYSPD